MGPCLEGIWRSSNLTSLTSGMSAITCSIVCLPLPFEGLGGVESIAEMRKTARLRKLSVHTSYIRKHCLGIILMSLIGVMTLVGAQEVGQSGVNKIG
jgi:hypothetical protein